MAGQRLPGRRELEPEPTSEGHEAVEEATGKGHVVVHDDRPVRRLVSGEQRVDVLELATGELVGGPFRDADAVTRGAQLVESGADQGRIGRMHGDDENVARRHLRGERGDAATRPADRQPRVEPAVPDAAQRAALAAYGAVCT